MIVIDSNYLCWVTKYSLSQGLSYRGKPTEIIYGFLKDVLSLAEKFNDNKFVFCWDSRESLRKKIYPKYKANRRENLTEEEKESNIIAYKQFDLLRERVLPDIGFMNNFKKDGYESDDIIAHIVMNRKDKPVVVSSDHDLYQLLDYCSLYNIGKHEIYDRRMFIDDYGIRPSRWSHVKSITGCDTDNVLGVKGVGEKTAIKYLKGELKKTTKSYENIESFVYPQGDSLPFGDYNLVKKLVTLPFEGFMESDDEIVIWKDTFSKEKLIDVFEQYGFNSFLKHFGKWEKAFLKERK